MGLDHLRRDAERGRAFGRVESGQAPARPGPEVVMAAARAQPGADLLDRVGDRAKRGLHGFYGAHVLAVHERKNFAGGQRVHRIGAWVGVLAHLPVRASAAAMPHARAAPWVAI